jgi:hypothetical protein
MSDERTTFEQTLHSHGLALEVLFAILVGLGCFVVGVGGLVGHDSLWRIAVALGALAFGTTVFMSCAYSLWGSCSVRAEGDRWVVVRMLGRWRSVASFSGADVREVSLDKLPGATVFPDGSGWYVRVSLRRSERSVKIGNGLHASREELEPIRSMIEQAR